MGEESDRPDAFRDGISSQARQPVRYGGVPGEGGGIYASNTLLMLLTSSVKINKASTSYDNVFTGP